jgi:hypothetical protein
MGIENNITIKINKDVLSLDWKEVEHKLAHLLLEDVIFCNNGWWYEEDGLPWQKDKVTLHVNCNDTFYYASADSEDITHGEINDLYEMWSKDNKYGATAWCVKKRKQKPLQLIIDEMTTLGYNIEELIK